MGESSSPYKYIIGANRDEFLDRPCTSAHCWNDPRSGHGYTFAGQDLTAFGTWLGVRAQLLKKPGEQSLLGPQPKPGNCEVDFRFGLITNFREGSVAKDESLPSRGDFIKDFLNEKNRLDAQAECEKIADNGHKYAGFNLILADKDGMYYITNRGKTHHPVSLETGVHGLSNGTLDDDWPKVVDGKRMFEEAIEEHISKGGRMAVTGEGILIDKIFRIMSDEKERGITQVSKGFTRDIEMQQSGIYVKQFPNRLPNGSTSFYGTRSTAVIIIRRDGTITYNEKYCSETQNATWKVDRFDLICTP